MALATEVFSLNKWFSFSFFSQELGCDTISQKLQPSNVNYPRHKDTTRDLIKKRENERPPIERKERDRWVESYCRNGQKREQRDFKL